MRHQCYIRFLFGVVFFSSLIISCVNEEEFSNNTSGNFEALWKTLDEHYCFFDLKKQELGVDWDEVHVRYAKQVKGQLSTNQLFEVCSNMLGELRDGHVNILSSFDYGHNWSWKEDYPTNLSDTLLRSYLGTDYKQTCGLQYRLLDDNIGYIRCSTFNTSFGEGNLDQIFNYFLAANGLIVDIRSNGGGNLTEAERLAQRFTNKDVLVGYIQHKTGKGHNDFSEMEEQHIYPSTHVRWQKGVVLLTNHGVYSAANEFAKYMKAFGVPIVGNQTGGGAGMPFSSELPNGWTIRFSACPMYDGKKQSTEHGIAPDYDVTITDDDFARGKDTVIEYARKLLNKD